MSGRKGYSREETKVTVCVEMYSAESVEVQKQSSRFKAQVVQVSEAHRGYSIEKRQKRECVVWFVRGEALRTAGPAREKEGAL